LISKPVRAYIFRGFVSCFVADTTLTPPAAGYKAFFYLEDFMEKSMSEVAVKTGKGAVIITQPNFQSENNEDVIMINKEQVDLLIEWLIEARDEAI